MLRTAFTFLALAVLSLSPAPGTPATPTEAHDSAQSAAALHHSRKRTHSKATTEAHRETRRTHNRRAARKTSRRQLTIAEPAALHSNRVAMPAPLVGSFESLARQNDKTEDDDLERIEDEDDLADRIARKVLVPVPASAALTVNGDLSESHRYCRPWTARFLTDLAKAHAALFHKPLEVSSAVRTVEYQKQLMQTNANAAAAEGDVVSPHVTGATVDVAKLGLSRQEMGWLRTWLLPLQKAGKIDVEEEFQQACFHITVYKSYIPPKPEGKAGPAKAGSGKPVRRQAVPSAPTQDKTAQESKLPPATLPSEFALLKR
jgi:hypothetical protein